MSGTRIAYGSIPLRLSYAVSGTEIAYGAGEAVGEAVEWEGGIAYADTQCPVLRSRVLLRDVRY
eukprot:1028530-Rhodomonas_salina.1